MLRAPIYGAKNNFAATADPTVNDDISLGYAIGSEWLRTDTAELFVCFDNTGGAAVWKEIAAGGGGVVHVAAADPTVNDDATKGFDPGSLWLNTITEKLWQCTDSSAGAAVWWPVVAPQTQIIYVGKNGNDSYDGKSIERAKLTFTAAITAAGTPADEANAVTIVCQDDGEYTENLTTVPFVNIHAPNATLKGVQGLSSNVSIKMRRFVNNGGFPVLSKETGQTGPTVIEADSVWTDAANNTAVQCTDGSLYLRIKDMVNAGAGGILWASGVDTTPLVHLDVDRMQCNDGALVLITEMIGGAGPKVVGRVGGMYATAGSIGINMGHVFDGPTYCSLSVSELNCATAYYVEKTNGTLRLIVGDISGTETAVDGADVRVTKAQRNNYIATTDPAVTDDDADGYTVGSSWLNTTTRHLWVCMDASTGAAVWDDIKTYLTNNNRWMQANTTTTDGDEACSTAIAATPEGAVHVLINGNEVPVGDGVKTQFCYFSGDGGTTARTFALIVATDKLYWVGSMAGYELSGTDAVTFVYEV
jgi:hypothetical protein